MKHLKSYRIFESQYNSELIKQLEKFGIRNYTINKDGTIDVDGNVHLNNKRLTKIPFKFGKVTGGFYCYLNELNSLEGCPSEVGIDFYCNTNNLKDLIGGPQEVGGNYGCYDNKLNSLEGCAGDIGENLYCQDNNLEMIDCSSVINGSIYCTGNGFEEEPEFFGICNKIIWK